MNCWTGPDVAGSEEGLHSVGCAACESGVGGGSSSKQVRLPPPCRPFFSKLPRVSMTSLHLLRGSRGQEQGPYEPIDPFLFLFVSWISPYFAVRGSTGASNVGFGDAASIACSLATHSYGVASSHTLQRWELLVERGPAIGSQTVGPGHWMVCSPDLSTGVHIQWVGLPKVQIGLP